MSPKRIRNLTVDEVYVRLTQKGAAFMERLGWSSLTEEPTDEDFLRHIMPWSSGYALHTHIRSRSEPVFFPGPMQSESTALGFRRTFPTVVDRVVAKAQRIVEGRFDLLGLSNLSFGQPINCHLEPISGKETF